MSRNGLSHSRVSECLQGEGYERLENGGLWRDPLGEASIQGLNVCRHGNGIITLALPECCFDDSWQGGWSQQDCWEAVVMGTRGATTEIEREVTAQNVVQRENW